MLMIILSTVLTQSREGVSDDRLMIREMMLLVKEADNLFDACEKRRVSIVRTAN